MFNSKMSDTSEIKNASKEIVRKAGLNSVESFIMAELAADFLKGIRWVFLFKDSPSYNEKLKMLRKAIQEGNLQNKVSLIVLEGGCIVEFSTDVIVNALKSMEGKLPGVDINQDIVLAKKNYKETVTEFEKYINSVVSKMKSNKARETVGIYCLNETPRISFTVNNELITVPAFRLANSYLFSLKQNFRTKGIQFEYGKMKFSPSKTGVLTVLDIKKI